MKCIPIFIQRIAVSIAFIVMSSVIHCLLGLAGYADYVHRCIVALKG